MARKPTHLNFAQAASLGVPYTTAWDALERSLVTADTRLLVIGGGAVGSAALALAKVRGAQVLAAARRPEQVKALQAQGYQTLQLDKPEDLGAQVNAVYAGGADVIFDTTGFWLPASVAAWLRSGASRSSPRRWTAWCSSGPGVVSQGWFGGGDQLLAVRGSGLCGDA